MKLLAIAALLLLPACGASVRADVGPDGVRTCVGAGTEPCEETPAQEP